MTIVSRCLRCAGPTRLAMLACVSCVLAACAARAPTRPTVAPTVSEHADTPVQRSEAETRRDLAKSNRYSLDPAQAGYYLDVLQGRLVQVLGADTKLSRTPDRIGIDLAHRVQFDARSPWLDTAGCRLLQPLAHALAEFGKTVIVVKVGVGGAGAETEMLAQRRARAVAECLSKSGIALRRIVIASTQTADTSPTTSALAGELELDVELILRDVKNER